MMITYSHTGNARNLKIKSFFIIDVIKLRKKKFSQKILIQINLDN